MARTTLKALWRQAASRMLAGLPDANYASETLALPGKALSCVLFVAVPRNCGGLLTAGTSRRSKTACFESYEFLMKYAVTFGPPTPSALISDTRTP